MYNAPLFASKPTFARIDFLRQAERLVTKLGTHSVKIITENQTKAFMLCTCACATARKARTLTTASASSCWDMLLTVNRDHIM